MNCAEPSRKIYLEVLRIIAIVGVVFNHTEFIGRVSESVGGSIGSLAMLALCVADKMAVPVFFIISGALLLPKEESPGVLFRKRILRYMLVILLFHIGHHLYACYCCDVAFSLPRFLLQCFIVGQAPLTATWWFLYAYLGFLLMLPFLRILARHMRDSHFVYLMVLHLLLFAFIPISVFSVRQSLFLCSMVPLCTLSGYYIENRLPLSHVTLPKLGAAIAVSVGSLCLTLALAEFYRLAHHEATYAAAVPCLYSGYLLPCLTLYLVLKKIWTSYRFPEKLNKVLAMLGSATFTIMLTENILRRAAERIWEACGADGSVLLRSAAITLLACALGFPLGIALKRIPGIRRLV